MRIGARLILFPTKWGDDLSSAGIRFTGNDNPGMRYLTTFVERHSVSYFLGKEKPHRDHNEKKTSKISIRQDISSVARRKGGVSFGCRYTLRPTFHLNNFRYLVDPSWKICMRRSRVRARAHIHGVQSFAFH